MIRFKNIYIEGFGSYISRKKFKLDRPGLNIVIAENGSGKTTTFSALTWAISGTPLKKTKSVTTWSHKQPKDFQGTYVELTFKKAKDTYSIIRLKNYKGKVLGAKGKDRLIIVKNDEALKFGDKHETQKAIYEILGFNEEILLNSLVFGQRMKRLIENTGPEKKRVFEEAFSASFLNTALVKAKEDLKDKNDELNPLERELDITITQKTTWKARLKHERQQLKDWKAEQEKKLIKASSDLAKAVNALPSHKITQEERDRLYNEAMTMEGDVVGWDTDIREHNKKVKDADTLVTQLKSEKDYLERTATKNSKEAKRNLANYSEGSVCTTCGTVLKKVDPKKIKALQKKLEEVQAQDMDAIDVNYKKLQEAKLKQASYTAALNEAKRQQKEILLQIASNLELVKEYDNTDKLKEAATINIKNLNKRLKELRKEKPMLDIKTTKKEYLLFKARYKDQRPPVRRLQREIEDLDWVISDLLSNKGLKAFIFDKMLERLNEKLRYYEQFIDYRVEFKVDLDGGNKDIYAICYTKGEVVFYEDLSGGEKQKVDAATAFALHDLIAHKSPTNLLVFDEPYDGLDSTNVEIISELIQEKSRDKTVFLITHDLTLQASSTKVIRMSKGEDGDTLHKTL